MKPYNAMPDHLHGHVCRYISNPAARDQVLDCIDAALLEAHQRGRWKGMEENQRLRQIISECAEASGAFVSPSASLDFMALLPKEIASVRAKLDEVQK